MTLRSENVEHVGLVALGDKREGVNTGRGGGGGHSVVINFTGYYRPRLKKEGRRGPSDQ